MNIEQKIQRYKEKSIDPCIDFYEHVCGNWAENNPISSLDQIWTELDKLQHDTDYRIKDT